MDQEANLVQNADQQWSVTIHRLEMLHEMKPIDQLPKRVLEFATVNSTSFQGMASGVPSTVPCRACSDA